MNGNNGRDLHSTIEGVQFDVKDDDDNETKSLNQKEKFKKWNRRIPMIFWKAQKDAISNFVPNVFIILYDIHNKFTRED